MTTLFLIRHGDNDLLGRHLLAGQKPGVHLNEHGRAQAGEILRTLGDLGFAAVYSSPLERAVETAAPLAARLEQALQVRDGLIDTDVGQWTLRSWKVLGRRKEWKLVQENPARFRFPGGESFAECQARVVAALEAIRASHATGELAAVVFHADPIKLAVAHYLGMPLDHFQRLQAETGSVTILQLDGKGARLVGANLIPPFSLPRL